MPTKSTFTQGYLEHKVLGDKHTFFWMLAIESHGGIVGTAVWKTKPSI